MSSARRTPLLTHWRYVFHAIAHRYYHVISHTRLVSRLTTSYDRELLEVTVSKIWIIIQELVVSGRQKLLQNQSVLMPEEICWLFSVDNLNLAKVESLETSHFHYQKCPVGYMIHYVINVNVHRRNWLNTVSIWSNLMSSCEYHLGTCINFYMICNLISYGQNKSLFVHHFSFHASWYKNLDSVPSVHRRVSRWGINFRLMARIS